MGATLDADHNLVDGLLKHDSILLDGDSLFTITLCRLGWHKDYASASAFGADLWSGVSPELCRELKGPKNTGTVLPALRGPWKHPTPLHTLPGLHADGAAPVLRARTFQPLALVYEAERILHELRMATPAGLAIVFVAELSAGLFQFNRGVQALQHALAAHFRTATLPPGMQ